MLERRDNIDHVMQVAPDDQPSMQLAEKVHLALEEAAGWQGAVTEQIVQISIPVADIEPVQWLREQTDEVKLFWGGRDDNFFTAAVGTADKMVATQALSFIELKQNTEEKLNRAAHNVRYYGGMQFDAGQIEADAQGAGLINGGQITVDQITVDQIKMGPLEAQSWSSLGNYCFVLPRVELQGVNGQYNLCCNLVLPRDLEDKDRLIAEIKSLKFAGHGLPETFPLPVSRRDSPEEANWHIAIKDALSMIQNGHPLEKIVLARKVEFSFAEPYDKFLLFKLLKDKTPDCFHFYFQLQHEYAFLGAPPERLYRRKGRSIVSEAVAGTGRRDDLNTLDIELGHALLLSDKDQREHAFVRRSIERVFSKICNTLKMDKSPSLMNLNIGRHLLSKFQGVLRDSVSDIDILHLLPPTSAVGGHPKKEALETIRQLESFDRGWYAGPIGWMSKEAAEFAVAIRSGMASSHTLALYSGAGIVDGSEPEAEWSEIEQKLGDFIRAIGLDQKSAKY